MDPDSEREAQGEERSENGQQRRNRELIELLNELRVALPGVQVLFAFLLTVPFSEGFGKLTEVQRAVYFSTLMAAAVASTLFMAPTSYHRIRFREGDKERMLRTSNRMTIVGVGFLALGIGGAVFLIADLMFGAAGAATAFAGMAGLVVWSWFALPLFRKLKDGSREVGD